MRGPASAALAAILLVLLAAAGSTDAGAPPQDRSPTFEGEILMRFRTEPPFHSQFLSLTSHIPLLARASNISYNDTLDTWRMRLRNTEAATATIAELQADPNVALAQRNHAYISADSPGDPMYTESQRPYLAALNAPAAWNVETGSAQVVVAVLDSGVDILHPELKSSIWVNPSEEPNSLDDDGNGCVDDISGCSFQEDPPNGNVRDLDGHGTFVAGIVGAKWDGTGVAGVNREVTIMPVRALDSSGIGSTEQLAGAVLYAARNGADVLNLSLALVEADGKCGTDPLVEDALVEAHDRGATIVAAAGNFDRACVAFPASSTHTIAVSASAAPWEADVRAVFSQWGPEVDVAAPGVDIVSTCPVPTVVPTSYCSGGSYGMGSGTSFSTPIVSGVAALLLSADPALTNEDVRERLRSTALPLPDDDHPNWDGGGRVDAAAALGSPSPLVVLDLEAKDMAGMDLSLRVADPAGPACTAAVWEGQPLAAERLHGSFGVGECGQYWPPTVERPWLLSGSYSGRKAALLNAWSLRQGDLTCAGEGVPTFITRTGALLDSVSCQAAGLVINDRREQATLVDVARLPRRFEQDVLHARSDGDPPLSCVSGSTRSVWYRLQAGTAPVGIAVDTFWSNFDTTLGVFRENSSGGMEEIACNNNFATVQSRAVWLAGTGSVYYIVAGAHQSVPAGRLRVNFSPADIPANDFRDSAMELPIGAAHLHVQAAHSATSSPDDPVLSCILGYGFSLWFSLKVDEPRRLTVTTAGSDYDTTLGVLRAQDGVQPQEIACNDDTVQGDRTSTAGWDAEPGDYLIVVGAYHGYLGSVLQLSASQE